METITKRAVLYVCVLLCAVGGFLPFFLSTKYVQLLLSILVLVTLCVLLLFFSPTKFLLGTRKVSFDSIFFMGSLFVMGEFLLERVLLLLGTHGVFLEIYVLLTRSLEHVAVLGMLIGTAILLLWSIIATLHIPTTKNSVLGVFDVGVVHGFTRMLFRVIVLFALSIFFTFFAVLLVYTWLLVLGSFPLIGVAVIVFFLVVFFANACSFSALDTRICFFAKTYLEPFVHAFFEKRMFLLGISGLLVLHIATNAFSLLLRYEELLELLPELDFSFHTFSVLLLLLTNIFAWFFLFCTPVYIWYKIACLRENNHPMHHPNFHAVTIASFSSSLTVLFLAPLITLQEQYLGTGLGLTLLPASHSNAAAYTPTLVLLFALIVFVVVFFLAQFSIKRFLYLVPLGAATIFVGLYAFFSFRNFFTQTLLFLFDILNTAQTTKNFLFAAVLVIIILLHALFYLSGFLFFLYEMFRD